MPWQSNNGGSGGPWGSGDGGGPRNPWGSGPQRGGGGSGGKSGPDFDDFIRRSQERLRGLPGGGNRTPWLYILLARSVSGCCSPPSTASMRRSAAW
jgi:membrane protease subunit HflK